MAIFFEDMMDIKEIKKLIALMQETGLAEIEVEESGRRVRLRRESLVALEAPRAISTSVGRIETLAASEPDVEGHFIRSPIVGTSYRASSPDQPPYAETDSIVKKGQTLCIVEAMKLMNEIESDIDGKIAHVCVEDGATVEYGTPLFRIEAP